MKVITSLQLMNLLKELMTSREYPVFGNDETGAVWHREQNVSVLLKFCPEGYEGARQYGHFLVGNSQTASYIAIPGRFTLREQPANGKTGFTLWQPLRGGECYYNSLEEMAEKGHEEADFIYGYWIGEIDPKTLKISEPH